VPWRGACGRREITQERKMLRLHILGAGTPTPTPTRFGTSYVAEVDGALVMIDCGPATTHKLVKAGLWPTDVDYLFFTHHHFDHVVDYPCFVLARWDQSLGTENQLQVFGPPPTEAVTETLLGENGVYASDWKDRVENPVSHRVFENRGGTLPRPPLRVLARDIGPGKVYSGKGWEVTAVHNMHRRPRLESLAYRLDTASGSIVFAGDTEPFEAVVDLARGADAMLCTCWDDQDKMEAEGESPGQCGTKGAARMAREAGVKTLVLGHMGPRISGREALEKGIGDIRDIYEGNVVVGEELMRLDI